VVYRLNPDVFGPGDGRDTLAVLDVDGYKVRVRKGGAPVDVPKPAKKKK
jgi:hypothetical protein